MWFSTNFDLCNFLKLRNKVIIFIRTTLLLSAGNALRKRQKPKTKDFGSPSSYLVFLELLSLQHVSKFIQYKHST